MRISRDSSLDSEERNDQQQLIEEEEQWVYKNKLDICACLILLVQFSLLSISVIFEYINSNFSDFIRSQWIICGLLCGITLLFSIFYLLYLDCEEDSKPLNTLLLFTTVTEILMITFFQSLFSDFQDKLAIAIFPVIVIVDILLMILIFKLKVGEQCRKYFGIFLIWVQIAGGFIALVLLKNGLLFLPPMYSLICVVSPIYMSLTGEPENRYWAVCAIWIWFTPGFLVFLTLQIYV